MRRDDFLWGRVGEMGRKTLPPLRSRDTMRASMVAESVSALLVESLKKQLVTLVFKKVGDGVDGYLKRRRMERTIERDAQSGGARAAGRARRTSTTRRVARVDLRAHRARASSAPR